MTDEAWRKFAEALTKRTPVVDDLEFGDFIEIYEDEIYCAYMESGSYYDTEFEDYQELEFEEYLLGHGQWARTPPSLIDTAVKV